jgi:hypothetical protein
LDASNIDALLDRARIISEHKGRPLGPFWFMSNDPDLPYDTPASGWAALYEAMRHAPKQRGRFMLRQPVSTVHGKDRGKRVELQGAPGLGVEGAAFDDVVHVAPQNP